MADKDMLDAILAAEENEPQDNIQEPQRPVNEATQYLGTQLHRNPMTGRTKEEDEADKNFAKNKGLSRIGEEIGQKAEYLDGWIDVNRELLGERNQFYPSSWQFRIRPATVDAIRNWSMIDDDNPLSIDDVFNEVLKSCLSIVTPLGPKPWGNICSWDRFFFLLLIREYTFKQGEGKITYEEDCPECDNPVKFNLTSQSLNYEYPDPELLSMYDPETRTWHIDPNEYEVESDPIKFYVPTLEKDEAIKKYLVSRYNENRNYKIDQVFLRFLQWMTPKLSKDETIVKRQIKELHAKYKSWNEEEFMFFDEVIKNIMITPDRNLKMTCPVCGEEVTSQMRFPNSVKDLFNVQTRRKKFGSRS